MLGGRLSRGDMVGSDWIRAVVLVYWYWCMPAGALCLGALQDKKPRFRLWLSSREDLLDQRAEDV